jgi:hypothetical protein
MTLSSVGRNREKFRAFEVRYTHSDVLRVDCRMSDAILRMTATFFVRVYFGKFCIGPTPGFAGVLVVCLLRP